ncbi:MAG TPA: DUF4267 domain-containing protein [Candidatus Elarobacter sp.]|jgi:hypothetical protein|nr:DUF4267 domain-containing protein [Candidatus Elarobacter sp.]
MTISQGMSYALAAAMLALSLRSAFAPRAAANDYGVPLPEDADPTPYLEVKANRDFVLAGLLVVVANAGHSVLAFALFIATIAPAADALTVKRHGKISATAVHLGTAAFMIVAGTLAALGH